LRTKEANAYFARMKVLLLAALLLVGCLPLKGQDYEITDVLSLKRYCNIIARSAKGDKLTEAETDILIYGRGYINGVIDDGSLDTAVGFVQPYELPANTTNNQVALVILKFIDAHPELAKRPACIVIGRALAEAYPNPKSLSPKR